MSEIKTKKNFDRRNGSNVVRKPINKDSVIGVTTVKTTDESDYEQRRVNSLLHVIFKICELSGFWVDERIVLKDRKTGKVWR